jgi:hypothetical protein
MLSYLAVNWSMPTIPVIAAVLAALYIIRFKNHSIVAVCQWLAEMVGDSPAVT